MARALLPLTLMTFLAQACVLPPPTPRTDASEPTLVIDHAKKVPLETVQKLERDKTAPSVTLSVQDTLVVPAGAPQPNVFWYLAYNNAAPTLEDAKGTNEFTVGGCNTKLVGPSNTFVVEAFITYGNIVLDGSSTTDKRVASGGEPVFPVTWSLELTGDASVGCQ